MRYEFTLDEIKVPVQLPNLNTLALDVVADVKVAVSIADDGEAIDPEILFGGKWQAVKGWLAEVIFENADHPFHQDKINSVLAGHGVKPFNPVREHVTHDARAL